MNKLKNNNVDEYFLFKKNLRGYQWSGEFMSNMKHSNLHSINLNNVSFFVLNNK